MEYPDHSEFSYSRDVFNDVIELDNTSDAFSDIDIKYEPKYSEVMESQSLDNSNWSGDTSLIQKSPIFPSTNESNMNADNSIKKMPLTRKILINGKEVTCMMLKIPQSNQVEKSQGNAKQSLTSSGNTSRDSKVSCSKCRKAVTIREFKQHMDSCTSKGYRISKPNPHRKASDSSSSASEHSPESRLIPNTITKIKHSNNSLLREVSFNKITRNSKMEAIVDKSRVSSRQSSSSSDLVLKTPQTNSRFQYYPRDSLQSITFTRIEKEPSPRIDIHEVQNVSSMNQGRYSSLRKSGNGEGLSSSEDSSDSDMNPNPNIQIKKVPTAMKNRSSQRSRRNRSYGEDWVVPDSVRTDSSIERNSYSHRPRDTLKSLSLTTTKPPLAEITIRKNKSISETKQRCSSRYLPSSENLFNCGSVGSDTSIAIKSQQHPRQSLESLSIIRTKVAPLAKVDKSENISRINQRRNSLPISRGDLSYCEKWMVSNSFYIDSSIKRSSSQDRQRPKEIPEFLSPTTTKKAVLAEIAAVKNNNISQIRERSSSSSKRSSGDLLYTGHGFICDSLDPDTSVVTTKLPTENYRSCPQSQQCPNEILEGLSTIRNEAALLAAVDKGENISRVNHTNISLPRRRSEYLSPDSVNADVGVTTENGKSCTQSQQRPKVILESSSTVRTEVAPIPEVDEDKNFSEINWRSSSSQKRARSNEDLLSDEYWMVYEPSTNTQTGIISRPSYEKTVNVISDVVLSKGRHPLILDDANRELLSEKPTKRDYAKLPNITSSASDKSDVKSKDTNVEAHDKRTSLGRNSRVKLNSSLLEDPTFSCLLCSFTADSKTGLANHQRKHRYTSKTLFKCIYCDQMYNRSDLQSHIHIAHPGRPFQFSEEINTNNTFRCNNCAFAANRKDLLREHLMRNKCSNKSRHKFNCPHCSYVASRLSYVKQHQKCHKRFGTITCRWCDFKSIPMSVKRHKWKCEGYLSKMKGKSTGGNNNGDIKEDVQCNFLTNLGVVSEKSTERDYPNLPNIRSSASTELDPKSKDETCDEPAPLDQNSNSPPLENSTFSCFLCSFTTHSKTSLLLHERNHRNAITSLFRCMYCNEKYTRSGLQSHIHSVHPGQKFQFSEGIYYKRENIFKYNNSKFSARNKPDLRQYRVMKRCTAMQGNNFNCPHCSYVSNSLRNIIRHQKSHKRFGMITCNWCDFKSIPMTVRHHKRKCEGYLRKMKQKAYKNVNEEAPVVDEAVQGSLIDSEAKSTFENRGTSVFEELESRSKGISSEGDKISIEDPKMTDSCSPDSQQFCISSKSNQYLSRLRGYKSIIGGGREDINSDAINLEEVSEKATERDDVQLSNITSSGSNELDLKSKETSVEPCDEPGLLHQNAEVNLSSSLLENMSCSVTADNKKTLQNHQRKHSKHRKARAILYQKYTKWELRSRTRNAHPGQKFQFSDEIHKREQNTRSKKNIFKCNNCDFTVGRKDLLRWHVMRRKCTYTSGKNFSCPQCSYITVSFSNLIRHQKSHIRFDIVSCPSCDFKSIPRAVQCHKRICEAYLSKMKGKPSKNANKEAPIADSESNLTSENRRISLYEELEPRPEETSYEIDNVSTEDPKVIHSIQSCHISEVNEGHANKHLLQSQGYKSVADGSEDINVDARNEGGQCDYLINSELLSEKTAKCDSAKLPNITSSASDKLDLKSKDTTVEPASLDRNSAVNLNSSELQSHIDNVHPRQEFQFSDGSRNRSKNNFFKCNNCDFTVSRKDLLIRHVRRRKCTYTSKKNDVRCPQCSYVTISFSNLSRHQKAHNRFDIISCPGCDFKSLPMAVQCHKQICKAYLSKMIGKPSKNANEEAPIADKETQRNLIDSESNLTSKNRITSLCEELERISKEINDKVDNVPIEDSQQPRITPEVNKRQVNCPQCSYTTSSRYKLRKHQKAHKFLPYIYCAWCDYRSTASAVKIHQRKCEGNFSRRERYNSTTETVHVAFGGSENLNLNSQEKCTTSNNSYQHSKRHKSIGTGSDGASDGNGKEERACLFRSRNIDENDNANQNAFTFGNTSTSREVGNESTLLDENSKVDLNSSFISSKSNNVFKENKGVSVKSRNSKFSVSKFAIEKQHPNKNLTATKKIVRMPSVKCPQCSWASISNANLNMHLNTHKYYQNISCVWCDYKSTPFALKKHSEKCEIRIKLIKSENIEKNDSVSSSTKAKKKNKRPNIKCPQCSYKATNATRVKFHLNTHKYFRTVSCAWCKYTSTPRCVGRHQMQCEARNLMGESSKKVTKAPNTNATNKEEQSGLPVSSTKANQTKCPQCSYKAKRSHVKTHVNTHKYLQNVSCPWCEYKSTPFALKRHQKKCEIRRKETKSENIEKNDRAEMRFIKCPQCSYKSINVNNIKLHRNSHKYFRNVPCAWCEFKSTPRCVGIHQKQCEARNLVEFKKITKAPNTNATNKGEQFGLPVSSTKAKLIKCAQCSHKLTRWRMKIHLNTHKYLPNVSCAWCEFKSTHHALIRHQQKCKSRNLVIRSSKIITKTPNKEEQSIPEILETIDNSSQGTLTFRNRSISSEVGTELVLLDYENCKIDREYPLKSPIYDTFKSKKRALSVNTSGILNIPLAKTKRDIYGANFKCPQCSYTTTNIYHGKLHQKTHKYNRNVSCIWCEFKSTPRAVGRHQRNCESRNIGSFENLTKASIGNDSDKEGQSSVFTSQNLEKSDSANHSSLVLRNTSLSSKVVNKSILLDDENSKKDQECSFKCSIPKNIFPDEKSTKLALSVDSSEIQKKRTNMNEIFKCPQCSYKTNRIYTLKLHTETHKYYKNMSCSWCEYKSTPYALKRHQGKCERQLKATEAPTFETNQKCPENQYDVNRLERYSENNGQAQSASGPIDNSKFQRSSDVIPTILRVHLERLLLCRNKVVDSEGSEEKIPLNVTEMNKSNLNAVTGKLCVRVLKCTLCSMMFTVQSKLERHMRLHQQNKRNKKCPHCNYRTTTIEYLDRHLQKHLVANQEGRTAHKRSETGTSGNLFKCTLCSVVCSSKAQYASHIRCHIGLKPMKRCPSCTFTSTPIIVAKHIKVTGHSCSKTKCPLCSALLSESGLRQHVASHKDAIKKCPDCDFKSTSTCLVNHMRAKGHFKNLVRKNVFESERISVKQPGMEGLEVHYENAQNLTPMQTDSDKSTEIVSNLRCKINCNLCSAVLLSEWRLKQHLASHKGPTKKCPKCDFRSTLSCLKKHIQTKGHHGKSISCVRKNRYQRKPNSPSNESTKQRRLEGLRSSPIFQCHLCSFSADLAMQLKIHNKNVHPEQNEIDSDKPVGTIDRSLCKVNCPLCSAVVAKTHLGQHLKAHKGRVKKCPQCDFKSTRACLIQHMQKKRHCRTYKPRVRKNNTNGLVNQPTPLEELNEHKRIVIVNSEQNKATFKLTQNIDTLTPIVLLQNEQLNENKRPEYDFESTNNQNQQISKSKSSVAESSDQSKLNIPPNETKTNLGRSQSSLKFQCYLCPFSFHLRIQLNVHMRKEHPQHNEATEPTT